VGVMDTRTGFSSLRGLHAPIAPACARSRFGGESVSPADIDLPDAAVAEIASILAKGYLRHRASSRRPQITMADTDTPPDSALASAPQQSVHVHVVNARSTGEK
jgi:hypothetical protein